MIGMISFLNSLLWESHTSEICICHRIASLVHNDRFPLLSGSSGGRALRGRVIRIATPVCAPVRNQDEEIHHDERNAPLVFPLRTRGRWHGGAVTDEVHSFFDAMIETKASNLIRPGVRTGAPSPFKRRRLWGQHIFSFTAMTDTQKLPGTVWCPGALL